MADPILYGSSVPPSGLHLIAANIPPETQVLENPSVEECIAERPDYVGISSLIKGFGKLSKMISLTRKYAPKGKTSWAASLSHRSVRADPGSSF